MERTAGKLRRLREAVKEAVYWMECYGADLHGGDYCCHEDCIRCRLDGALTRSYERSRKPPPTGRDG